MNIDMCFLVIIVIVQEEGSEYFLMNIFRIKLYLNLILQIWCELRIQE